MLVNQRESSHHGSISSQVKAREATQIIWSERNDALERRVSNTDPVIGIDLGTTNSCVTVVVEGAVHVIPDETGQTLQSSIVAFLGDGSVVVGNQGRAEVMVDPINTVYSAKRLIGRAFESHQVQDAMRILPTKWFEGVSNNHSSRFGERPMRSQK